MKNGPNKIEEKVMAKIKSGKVRLRSKYIFLAEKLGLGSAFILSVLLAVLFFNLALFTLKSSDNLGYLSFGSRGIFAFLECFPYQLIIIFVVFIFIAGFILKKNDILYKKPFGRLALGLMGLVVIAGVILAFTNIAERIEQRVYGSHPGGNFFRPLFSRGLEERQRGIAGRVVEIGNGYLNIQTPFGVKKIDLSKLDMPVPEEMATGSFIMAAGKNKEDVFEARMIRVANPEEMPIIQRGVHRRFGSFNPMMRPPIGEESARCLRNCLDFGDVVPSSSCREECRMRVK